MKKYKGCLSVITVLAMLVSMFAVNLAVCAEGAEELPVHIASEEFSGTQGENGWSYYGYNGKTEKYLATDQYKYDSAKNEWLTSVTSGGSGRGKIWENEMLPGVDTSTRMGVVRAYTADDKGTVTIDTNGAISAKDSDTTDFFNVNIRIRKNDVTIYPKNGEWEEMTSRTEASAFQKIEGIDVKKGDVITFEAIRGADGTSASAMTKNIIVWDPVIRYTKIVQRQVIYSDNFETLNTDFWRNKTEDWTVEDGKLKNSGTSSYIRFYAPNAVNYSMSFDLKFVNIGTSSSDQSGFFVTTRRSNDASGLYYRVRLDLLASAVKKDIVHGLGLADAFKSTDTAKPMRVKQGETAWETEQLYHITESVETDENSDTVLTFTVTDSEGALVSSFTRSFSGEDVCPSGGGGLSFIGDHQVEISNFVLEGETSELIVDDNVEFFADKELQIPAAADNISDGLFAAIKTTSGFSNDFSSKQTPRTIILAAYEKEEDGGLMLKAVNMKSAYVTSATNVVSVLLAADEVEPGLTYRAFVWEGIGTMNPCAPVKELE